MPNSTRARDCLAFLFLMAHLGACYEFLNQIMNRISQSVPREIMMLNVTTVIGTHAGPNGLGFAAVRKNRTRISRMTKIYTEI